MTDRQLISLLHQAGFEGKPLRIAYGIAKRESGGNPHAYNPDRGTGDDSYGLFQINMLGDLGPSRRAMFGLTANTDLYDPLTNAKAAFRMSQGGQDFGAWGIGPNAYRSGAGMETIQHFIDSGPWGPMKAGEEAVNDGAPTGLAIPDWNVGDLLDGEAKKGDPLKLDPLPFGETGGKDEETPDHGFSFDPLPVFGAAKAPPQAAAPASGIFKPGGGWGGSHHIAIGFRNLAEQSGLKVMSEKRDRKLTTSGHPSDHWVGSKQSYAFDMSNGSAPTPEMDEAAHRILETLGDSWDGHSAIVRNFNRNGYRIQILYRTNVGGNHFNHIHIGVRKL